MLQLRSCGLTKMSVYYSMIRNRNKQKKEIYE